MTSWDKSQNDTIFDTNMGPLLVLIFVDIQVLYVGKINYKGIKNKVIT